MADPHDPIPVPIPAAKHIFTFPAGEQIVSMVRFRDKLLIATNRSVYSTQHDAVTELQFRYEGQNPAD